jgi:hypothetical protein
MEKKNNHYIPKCLLKRWVTNDKKYKGVYILDFISREVSYQCSQGKNAFPFSSIDNFYTLKRNGERLLNLENWFGGLENALSIFIDKITQKEANPFKHIGQLNKLVMGLNSFEFRSPYFFEKANQYLEQNPEIKKSFKDKSNLQIILENVVIGTSELTNLTFPVEFLVLNSNVPILLCDRPLVRNMVDNYSFIPLTPNLILSFRKTSKESIISYKMIDENLSTNFNNIMKDRARTWIASVDNIGLKNIEIRPGREETIEYPEIKTFIKAYEF